MLLLESILITLILLDNGSILVNITIYLWICCINAQFSYSTRQIWLIQQILTKSYFDFRLLLRPLLQIIILIDHIELIISLILEIVLCVLSLLLIRRVTIDLITCKFLYTQNLCRIFCTLIVSAVEANFLNLFVLLKHTMIWADSSLWIGIILSQLDSLQLYFLFGLEYDLIGSILLTLVGDSLKFSNILTCHLLTPFISISKNIYIFFIKHLWVPLFCP